jgi:hypothetical protein
VGGTQLRRGGTAQITVNASQAGKLDAWIDFDQDGQFEASEKLLTTDLTANNNSISVPVPVTAQLGSTYARFRFSTAGNLGPTGLANDGEVEDYSITIDPNPWQNPGPNPTDRLDVNDDGQVTPLDALLIINRQNFNNTLPPTGQGPPYYDVDGDGTLAPLDALLVINFLNDRSAQSEAMQANASSARSSFNEEVASARGSSTPAEAPASSLPPAFDSGAPAQGEPTSDSGFDYGAFAANGPSALPSAIFEESEDEDEYNAILAGGDAGEAADDFFAWFGQ